MILGVDLFFLEDLWIEKSLHGGIFAITLQYLNRNV